MIGLIQFQESWEASWCVVVEKQTHRAIGQRGSQLSTSRVFPKGSNDTWANIRKSLLHQKAHTITHYTALVEYWGWNWLDIHMLFVQMYFAWNVRGKYISALLDFCAAACLFIVHIVGSWLVVNQASRVIVAQAPLCIVSLRPPLSTHRFNVDTSWIILPLGSCIVAGCRKSSQLLQAFQAVVAEKLPLGFNCLFENTNSWC